MDTKDRAELVREYRLCMKQARYSRDDVSYMARMDAGDGFAVPEARRVRSRLRVRKRPSTARAAVNARRDSAKLGQHAADFDPDY